MKSRDAAFDVDQYANIRYNSPWVREPVTDNDQDDFFLGSAYWIPGPRGLPTVRNPPLVGPGNRYGIRPQIGEDYVIYVTFNRTGRMVPVHYTESLGALHVTGLSADATAMYRNSFPCHTDRGCRRALADLAYVADNETIVSVPTMLFRPGSDPVPRFAGAHERNYGVYDGTRSTLYTVNYRETILTWIAGGTVRVPSTVVMPRSAFETIDETTVRSHVHTSPDGRDVTHELRAVRKRVEAGYDRAVGSGVTEHRSIEREWIEFHWEGPGTRSGISQPAPNAFDGPDGGWYLPGAVAVNGDHVVWPVLAPGRVGSLEDGPYVSIADATAAHAAHDRDRHWTPPDQREFEGGCVRASDLTGHPRDLFHSCARIYLDGRDAGLHHDYHIYESDLYDLQLAPGGAFVVPGVDRSGTRGAVFHVPGLGHTGFAADGGRALVVQEAAGAPAVFAWVRPTSLTKYDLRARRVASDGSVQRGPVVTTDSGRPLPLTLGGSVHVAHANGNCLYYEIADRNSTSPCANPHQNTVEGAAPIAQGLRANAETVSWLTDNSPAELARDVAVYRWETNRTRLLTDASPRTLDAPFPEVYDFDLDGDLLVWSANVFTPAVGDFGVTTFQHQHGFVFAHNLAANETYLLHDSPLPVYRVEAEDGRIAWEALDQNDDGTFDVEIYTATETGWTVAVYLAGHNDAEDALAADYAEIAAVGGSDAVRIVTFRDIGSADRIEVDVFDGEHESKTRDFTLATGIPATGVDSADGATVQAFLEWTKRAYPGDNYLIVVGGQGQGWRGVALDRGARSIMTANEFGQAMAGFRRGVERESVVVGLDLPWSASVEIVEEVSLSARYLIASEDTVHETGWPYDDVLRVMLDDPEITPRDLATEIVDRYGDAHDAVAPSYSVSAIDLDADLLDRLSEMNTVLLNRYAAGDRRVRHGLVLSVANATVGATRTDPTFVDLHAFASQLGRDQAADGALRTATRLTAEEVSRAAIAHRMGPDAPAGSGIAIYLPSRAVFEHERTASDYGRLWLPSNSRWDDVLELMSPTHSVLYRIPPRPGVPGDSWRGRVVRGGLQRYPDPTALIAVLSDDTDPRSGRTIPWLVGRVSESGNATTHVRVAVDGDVTFADDRGYYYLPSTFFGVGDAPTVTVALRDKGVPTALGTSYVHVVNRSAGAPLTPVSLATLVTIRTRSDVNVTVDFATAGGQLPTYAAIYNRTLQAVELAEQVLVINLSHPAQPLEIVANDPSGSAFYDWDPRPAIGTPGTSVHVPGNQSRAHPARTRNSPKNLEWHEFGHHVMWVSDICGRHQYCNRTGVPHRGYLNADSSNAVSEGFAEFYSLLVGDVIENQSAPNRVLYLGANMESNRRNWRVASPQVGFEEYAYAGILWDLYDPVNAMDSDPVDLSIDQVWDTLESLPRGNARINRTYHLFLPIVGAPGLNQIYGSHHVFNVAPGSAGVDGAFGVSSWGLRQVGVLPDGRPLVIAVANHAMANWPAVAAGGALTHTDREQFPVPPGAYVAFDLVAVESATIPEQFQVQVTVDYDEPNDYYSYSYNATVYREDPRIVMLPPGVGRDTNFSVTFRVRATGFLPSDTVTVDGANVTGLYNENVFSDDPRPAFLTLSVELEEEEVDGVGRLPSVVFLVVLLVLAGTVVYLVRRWRRGGQ